MAFSPAQCRAARGLLDWSQQQLADAARVGVVTVRQFEGGASQPRNATLDVLQRALESAGVEFIAENGGGPGVRLNGGTGGLTIKAMKYEVTPSHDGQTEGIRDRMAKEDTSKTPEKGMEMLRRGRAENELRRARKKGRRKKDTPPNTTAGEDINASNDE
jgi:transcriptional regulator with XRE-family HTH domain